MALLSPPPAPRLAPGRALGWALAALLLWTAALAGCRPRPATETATPRRIVAIAPSVVEILFALELGDRVAGVGDYASFPAAALDKPRIGGLFDARLEQIAALEPDLAILLPSEADLARKLEALGVEVMTVPSESLADVAEAVRRIGERAGAEAAAAEFLAAWRRELAPDPLPGAPRVLLSLAREPQRLTGILVAGPGTFLDELLDRLGAENVVADASIGYPQIGAEELLERQPAVILELQPRPVDAAAAAALRDDWRRLPGLAAAAAGCVRVIGGEHTLLPGPRLPRLYAELRREILACSGSGDEE